MDPNKMVNLCLLWSVNGLYLWAYLYLSSANRSIPSSTFFLSPHTHALPLNYYPLALGTSVTWDLPLSAPLCEPVQLTNLAESWNNGGVGGVIFLRLFSYRPSKSNQFSEGSDKLQSWCKEQEVCCKEQGGIIQHRAKEQKKGRQNRRGRSGSWGVVLDWICTLCSLFVPWGCTEFVGLLSPWMSSSQSM